MNNDRLTLSQLARQHLQLRMMPIHRSLRAAVQRQQQIAASLQRPDLTHICISDEQVTYLLDRIDRDGLCSNPQPLATGSTAAEHAIEDRLRAQAQLLGCDLPIDLLQKELELSSFECDAVLLSVAPEISTAYERIFAYILDDLNRYLPCVELVCRVLSGDPNNYYAHKKLLGPMGRLQRIGMLKAQGIGKTGLRQEIKPAFGVVERLNEGTQTWRDHFFDPDERVADDDLHIDHLPQKNELGAIADALSLGTVSMVGIWGHTQCGGMDAVSLLAESTGKSVRVMPADPNKLPAALETACYLNAMLWLDTDALNALDSREYRQELVGRLLYSRVPVVLTGTQAWRPTALLAARNYVELYLQLPGATMRRILWEKYLPDLEPERIVDIANRYRFTRQEVRAVSRTAKCLTALDKPAEAVSRRQLVDACVLVSRQQGSRLAQPFIPKRGPADLILPVGLHAQVMEVARFYRALSVVDEDWGFGRIASGGGGIKVLFTGDSGTGKTLAAEVIAKKIGLPMLKVDVAQLISKWVGETEKNIDAVFKEAESSNTVLFFDEADALFGKRGEVSKGSDRYANLEVGYLLQRLEQFFGLAILASNLKDEIDKAFIRRFHIVLHFPRPQKEERQRLWQLAFPPDAPLDPAVNLNALTNLDMTGASIVNASHTAALLAADEGCPVIRFDHITEGIARQFQREARVMGAIDVLQAHTQFARAT